MGFYSHVQVTAEEEAYRFLLPKFGPFNVKHFERDGVHVMDIGWVKWYSDFEEVEEVNRACDELNLSHYNEDGYGYRMIVLNEDDTSEVTENMRGADRFSDVYTFVRIRNPYAPEAEA